jgi:hypothetical protein
MMAEGEAHQLYKNKTSFLFDNLHHPLRLLFWWVVDFLAVAFRRPNTAKNRKKIPFLNVRTFLRIVRQREFISLRRSESNFIASCTYSTKRVCMSKLIQPNARGISFRFLSNTSACIFVCIFKFSRFFLLDRQNLPPLHHVVEGLFGDWPSSVGEGRFYC